MRFTGRESAIGTREKIVAAASEMMRDSSTSRLSVRAVAARAGVGASTLRHYFPTQRALFDTVLEAVYVDAFPDDRIRDVSVPARDRLMECLWNLLEPFDTELNARRSWATIFHTFIEPEPTPAMRSGYTLLVQKAEQRVESWLVVLEAEGALPPGDSMQRTRFLLTVIDGLSLERGLPLEASRLADESATLGMAVDAVLGAPATPAS
jgi:AcrR family transcriptional regulator